ncbi:MAG: outer membrane lipoprotein-sorting protein [Gammaproteobacteria bacterium]
MNKLLLLTLLASLLVSGALAATPEEARGLEIAIEADRRDTGFKNSRADMLMVLQNRQGQTSERRLRIKTLEVENDGDKSLSIFDHPADIKGTAFLSYTHSIEPDDQWLYLPALRRVKRISSRNKSGPFMGSEFAYEDLTSSEVDKYTYKYLRDEELEGHATFVIERYPAYEDSGYTRQIVWIDQKIYQPRKIEFYDRKNTLLKTLIPTDYNQYLGRYWRPNHMHMVNHQTGKSTRLTWNNYRFQTGLTERDFDRNSLKRAR